MKKVHGLTGKPSNRAGKFKGGPYVKRSIAFPEAALDVIKARAESEDKTVNALVLEACATYCASV